MAEDVVAVGLLSLPLEILHVIAEYLSPRDLLAASAACRYLRSVFNVNSLWRKYTNGGVISQGLSSSNSLVEPKFQNCSITSLEPLCEHRLHFLKQSRLLSNFRQAKFVEHSTEFRGFLSEFETVKPINSRRITYSGKFLFAVDYERDDEVIKVFDIEISPKLILVVNLENHSASYCVVTWVQVVDNKLVVRRDSWFDVYEIKLPESLELLYSINVDEHGNQSINKTLIINKLLFVENCTKNVVNVWNMTNGNQCSDLVPKFSGPDINILGHSQNEETVVLSVGMFVGEPSDPHVFVYRIKTQDFSPFNPLLNKEDFKCHECYGLIDSEHVVILNERFSLNYSVFVFDYESSTLVVEKSNLVTRRIEDAKLLDGYLVLPSLVSVIVMSLKSLQTIWEFQLDTARSLVYEFPLISMIGMEVLHLSSLSSIVVIHNVSGIEMWDFHSRTKILDLPEKGNVVLNDTYTKLIICDFHHMKVLSFW